MPEHLHLLVSPETPQVTINYLLSAIKQPFAVRIKLLPLESGSPLIGWLTVQERPGKTAVRYWQERTGYYYRNLSSVKAVLAAIEYIHRNPWRRSLIDEATHWKWSSARWYASDC